ncbi:hypothetical protein BASA60_010673 [Batrachochytrium salamandrivorans]|nr:hypothetical protein BASA60_010673 [Batrachochytrium salamandrivorans]
MGTIADWATRWEMSFGVAKCGIMHVAPIPAPLSRLRFCQLNSQSESAAAETADQTPITPSSHPSSPNIPIKFSLYLFRYLQYFKLSPFLTPIHQQQYLYSIITPFPNQLYSLHQQHPPKPSSPIPSNSMLKHQPIHPKHPSINTSITTTSTTIPSTPTIAEIRHQRSKYAFERTFQVWGKSKLACSYVQANHASSAKFLRSPALSTGQAIGASLLSLARCGGLWDYPRALKADTRFEPPISVAHSEIPRQVQDTVEENPTASRTTTTDTHTAAISSTPTPTQISYIGSDDILTVLLGGSLPGTNTAGNTEAYPGQQWLTGTVEEGNLLSVNQPVAHRMCDFLQISVRVYRAMLWKHHKSNLSHIPDI